MLGIESHHAMCRKRGFVLTCYVDGKKRFRAVRSSVIEFIQPAGTPEPRDAATRRTPGTAH